MTSSMLKIFGGALLALLAAAATAAQTGPVGRFQVVSGDVQIISGGKARPAARGDAVNERDTIVTGKDGLGHIRMIDEGIIAMRPDSRIVIDNYRWEGKEDGTERSVVSLLKGGFRAITGVIGRSNKTSYQVNTTTATIGIRGTDHEPFFIPPPEPGETASGEPGTYNKVNLGETFIRSKAGVIDLGANEIGFAPIDPGRPPLKLDRVPTFMARAAMPPRGKPDMRNVREFAARDPRGAQLVQAMREGEITPRQFRQILAFRMRTAGEDFDLAGQDADFFRAANGVALSGSIIYRDGASLAGNVGSVFVAPSSGDSILLDRSNNPRIVTDASGFRYAREGAPLIDSGSAFVDGAGVKWGVYAGGLRFSEGQGVSQALLFTFMLTSQFTPINAISSPSPVLLSFNDTIGFTRPVDNNRNVGGTAALVANVLVGPTNASLVGYNLNVNDANGRTWNATLNSPQSLQSFSRSPSTPNLSVTCAGACASTGQGSASGLVIGDNARGMISSYGLIAGPASVVGSVLVRR